MPFDPPLYLVSDRRRFPAPPPGALFADQEWNVLGAAIDAGIGALQLREKDLDGRLLYERAARLAERCRARGVRFLVNDRADVALGAAADGVHLPADGLPAGAVRRLVPLGALIGCSVHSHQELKRSEGADFVVFGPIFDTPSKREFGPAQGLGRLAEISRASSLPVCAIGGITRARVADLIASGAAGIAVMGEILDAADPARAVAGLLRELGRSAASTAKAKARS